MRLIEQQLRGQVSHNEAHSGRRPTIGRIYYPARYMTNENLECFQGAYENVIDTYAAATQHLDQGLSLTLFFKDTPTTRDVNKAQMYAWRKGIKTLYYIRLRQMALEETEVEGCVSCML
jgi:ribonucleotide reductase alpha subunit